MNYGKDGYKGVTETWNIVQHEVINSDFTQYVLTSKKVQFWKIKVIFYYFSITVEMLWCSRIQGLDKYYIFRILQFRS